MRLSEIVWDDYYGEGSLDAITRFEEIAGVSLPPSYKQLVLAHDGAFPVDNISISYIGPFSTEIREVGLSMLFPLKHVKNSSASPPMFRVQAGPPQGFPKGLVAFAETGGGDLFCFDYRTDQSARNPPVCIWHHEAEDANPLAVVRLAESFDDFLGKFYPDED